MSAVVQTEAIHTTYIHDRICSAREEQLLVLRQTEAQHTTLVRLQYSPAFVCVEAVNLSCLAQNECNTTCSTYKYLSTLRTREYVLRRHGQREYALVVLHAMRQHGRPTRRPLHAVTFRSTIMLRRSCHWQSQPGFIKRRGSGACMSRGESSLD
jgi:hypothetical protein